MSVIKFKEIEQGMTIHCSTEGEAEDLLKHLDGLGYKWNDGGLLVEDTIYDRYGKNTCFFIEEDYRVTHRDIDYFKSEGYEVTEFSDLIEPELTAEEAIRLQAEMCSITGCGNCAFWEARGRGLIECSKWRKDHPEEAVKILAKYRADHEKKEPKVELQEAARPLVEYLRKNYHPHATAIVSLDYAEVLEGKESAKYGEM